MAILNDLKTIFEGKKNPAQTNTDTTPKKKILIVEDEKMLSDALGFKLSSAGFETIKAENGQIGLEKAISEKPNIILLDLKMPVMDGKTMLRKLRETPGFKNLPVIILTNEGDVENIKETELYYDAADFFIKSNISMEKILTRIKSLI